MDGPNCFLHIVFNQHTARHSHLPARATSRIPAILMKFGFRCRDMKLTTSGFLEENRISDRVNSLSDGKLKKKWDLKIETKP